VHLATKLPDGAPHSVAIWAGLDGDRIVFFTQSHSLKAKNLARDPRVALSVVDFENPYRSAQIRGRVVEVREGDEVWQTIDKLAVVYTGEPLPWRTATSVVFVVEPERVRFTELPFAHRPGIGG
jgi:PPOX class probable F420-dependent enzyme